MHLWTETRDLVNASKQMVQIGSQHRSEPYQIAVRDIVRSGRIGEIVHIEQEWNVNEERWRFVSMDTGNSAEMERDSNMEWKKWLYESPSKLREEDTDGSAGCWANLTAPSILMCILNSVSIRIIPRASSTNG